MRMRILKFMVISVRDAETVWQYFHKNGTH